MENTIWYRISNDLQVSEHEKPELSLSNNTKYWLEAVHNGRKHITTKYIHPLFDYKIYNAYLEPTEIKEHYLKCSKIYDTNATYFGNEICFEIADINNYKERVYFGNVAEGGTFRENTILEGIVYMKEFGFLKYWEAIKPTEENIELKKKVSELYEQIKVLKSK